MSKKEGHSKSRFLLFDMSGFVTFGASGCKGNKALDAQ
jgi:hypothetical protein